MTFYAFLGNTPDLSIAELESLTGQKTEFVASHLVSLEQPQPEFKIMTQKIGGVVKFLEKIASIPNASEDVVQAKLLDFLTKQDGKVTFGLSQLPSGSTMPVTTSSLKQALKEHGVASRFLDHDGSQDLSAAYWQKNPDLHEFFLVRQEDAYLLLRTIWVQDISDWSKRDRSKPYADRKKGMLPPKVARMMVNLVSAKLSDKTTAQDTPTTITDSNTQPKVLYDPFCGSGTILMEAALQSYHLAGSDLDLNSVVGTKQNLEWLAHEYELEIEATVLQHDATQNVPPNIPQVDAIVTEPFLGKPKPSPDKAKDTISGLERLYLGAFKKWRSHLKPGGEVVIIFPAIVTLKHTFTLENLIDKLEKIGYIASLGPLEYNRAQAIVRRQIYKFSYQPT